jgi:hypothetical protein
MSSMLPGLLRLLVLLAVATVGCAKAECSFNSDCAAGLCSDGTCVRQCFATVDCPSDRSACERGVCMPASTDASIDTAIDTGAADAAAGDSASVSDTTTTDDGSAGDTSVSETATKSYLTKCAVNGECASGTCKTFCTKACTTHGDCAHGQLCSGGLCNVDDTGKTGCDLSSGSPCLEFCFGSATAKHCTHSCASASECPAGYACSPASGGKKVCVEIEKPCGDATQCASGLGFCGGVGCTAACDSASDCPLRLVGLPPYTCELRSGQKVCIAPADVLGADAIGATCPATGTNKCRSGACDPGTSPPSCVQRCSTRGGCPPAYGCFPLEDPGPPKSASLVCSAAGSLWLGDACTRGRDCLTGICQAPGYCTRLCVDGLCPDGMSCVAAALTADDGTPIKLCTK